MVNILLSLILFCIFAPVLTGIAVGAFRLQRKTRNILVLCASVLTALCVTAVAFLTAREENGVYSKLILEIAPLVTIRLGVDSVSRIFSCVAAYSWVLVSLFSFSYTKQDKSEPRFYAFFLVALGMVLGMDYSGDLITAYCFYELITLSTFPLVLHSLKKPAARAALKYLFYSIAGGFLALIGIVFFISTYHSSGFISGGIDTAKAVPLIPLFLAIIGFGAKAGLFPLHGWLPTAHPEAPAPASALLSGIIVKAGVLAIIRVVFFIVGADAIRGSWVQLAWTALALLTIFMGSMMAYREKQFKKRLAYSTVSQLSYILLGLSLLSSAGIKGALLHTIFHAFIKCGLFLAAGAVIYKTGITHTDGLSGIGKRMPVTMVCFTVCSLALVGIPPTSGFLSKWYIASAALQAYPGALGLVCCAVLLLSALLTAGYLLSISVKAFFPGDTAVVTERCEADWKMLLPLIAFAAAALLLGLVLPEALVSLIDSVAI